MLYMLQRGSTPLRRRQQKRCPLHIPAAVRACACSRRAGCTLPEAFSQCAAKDTRKFKVGARMVSLGLRRCCPASTQRLHQLRRLSILQALLDVERLLLHRAGAALGPVGDVETKVRHVPQAGRSSTGNLHCLSRMPLTMLPSWGVGAAVQYLAMEGCGMGCTAGLRPPPGIMPSTSCRNCKGYQRAVQCKPAQRPNWLWALLGSSAQ